MKGSNKNSYIVTYIYIYIRLFDIGREEPSFFLTNAIFKIYIRSMNVSVGCLTSKCVKQKTKQIGPNQQVNITVG